MPGWVKVSDDVQACSDQSCRLFPAFPPQIPFHMSPE
nr:MAG TPA_asm: hypothetical protein [Caudoviricetes sp.]